SSSRRHTRSKRDWSSDVCSSDLIDIEGEAHGGQHRRHHQVTAERVPGLHLTGLGDEDPGRRVDAHVCSCSPARAWLTALARMSLMASVIWSMSTTPRNSPSSSTTVVKLNRAVISSLSASLMVARGS